MTTARRPRKTKLWCCGGCALPVLVIMALVSWYAGPGTYRPRIPPRPAPPSPNAYDDYAAAMAIVVANGDEEPSFARTRQWEPLPLDQERSLVQRNAAALARVRLAFTKRCQAPSRRGDTASGFPPVRSLAFLFRAEADLRASRGDAVGAFESGLDALQMSMEVRRGGRLIDAHVGSVAEMTVDTPLAAYLERLSAAEVDQCLGRMLAIERTRPPYVDALREERTCQLQDIMAAYPRPLSTSLNRYPTASDRLKTRASPIVAPFDRIAGRAAWRALSDRTLRETEVFWDSIIVQAGRPARLRRMPALPASPIAATLAPLYVGTTDGIDRRTVCTRLILCALAIRQYRLRHGRLPTRLHDISLPRDLILDPFGGGGPFVYRPQSRDYMLYSVGIDQRDNLGIPETYTGGDQGMTTYSGPNPEGKVSSDTYRPVPHMQPPRVLPGWPKLGPEWR